MIYKVSVNSNPKAFQNIDVLDEVYFGKGTVEPLQRQFSIIRNKFKGKPYSTSMSIDKDVLKFNRLCESIFGYETFALSISTDHSVNAYALPTTLYQTKEEKQASISALKSNKGGFRFDKSRMGLISAMAAINIGTLDYDKLTDEEIVAILLHEIGHTFFYAVTDKDCIYSLTNSIVQAIKNVNNTILSKISNGILHNTSMKTIADDVSFYCRGIVAKSTGFLSNIAQPSSICSRLKSFFTKHEAMSNNMRGSMFGYTNEKFADTFAAMYGYSAELHSGLLKMYQGYFDEHPMKKGNSVSTTFKVYNLYLANLLAYILHIKDVHPEGLARVKVATEYIKKELANESIDPKMKKDLMKQLEELNGLIDDFVNFPKDQDTMGYIRAYYILLYKKFGGDIREKDADNEALFKTIDDRYNEVGK